MQIISWILQNPTLWVLSQKIFGDDKEKMKLYRSVITHRGKILDFGCSNGNTFPIFSDFEYYGYDNDKIMIRDAKNKYKKFLNAKFYVIDILKNKSPQKNFDYVLFALTGHHLDDKTLVNIFSKLASVLKKGGKILYFDSIRSPKRDSLLLKIIMNMDQGKFIRTLKEYEVIKKDLPKNLKITKNKRYQVRGTFMPQPKYLFWELKKI